MADSTIPYAIDGLLTLFKTKNGMAKLQIIDGQPTVDLESDYLAIGYSSSLGIPAVSGSQAPYAIGNLRRIETYDIACEASSFNGSFVMKKARDRAFQIFGYVEEVVRADGTLNASIMFGDIGNIQVEQTQTSKGAVCNVNFTISVKITRL